MVFVRNRSSGIVKLARIFQLASRYWRFVDAPAEWVTRKWNKEHTPCLVVILAPPRSGSTLTYQLLASGMQCYYLSNLWNLLYATPVIGKLLSDFWCRDHLSSFSSKHGFTAGLCGEAEGKRFWEFWAGQGLVEDRDAWQYKRVKRMRDKLSAATTSANPTWVCGYLGHAFCVHMLRQLFPRILFVHVTRHWLSNAYSLWQATDAQWFSSKPEGYQALLEKPSHERAVWQVMQVHLRILQQRKREDTISVDYQDVCSQPHRVIDRIIDYGRDNKLPLERSNTYSKVPSDFAMREVNSGLNQDTAAIEKYIQRYYTDIPANYQPFFKKMIQW